MADILAANVTVTINRKEDRNGMKRNYCTVSFGNGTLTYPTGGVPLAKGRLGMARSVDSVSFTESNTLDYHVEYDISASTIRLSQGDYSVGTDGTFIELTNSVTPAAQVIRMVVDGY